VQLADYFASEYDPHWALIHASMVRHPPVSFGEELSLTPALLGKPDSAPTVDQYGDSYAGGYGGVSPVWRPLGDMLLTRDPVFEPLWNELEAKGPQAWASFRSSAEFEPIVETLALRGSGVLRKGARLLARYGPKVVRGLALPTTPAGAALWLAEGLVRAGAVEATIRVTRAAIRESRNPPPRPPFHQTRPVDPREFRRGNDTLMFEPIDDPWDAPFAAATEWIDAGIDSADRWLDSVFVKLDDWLF
jgi:hypothetical protein